MIEHHIYIYGEIDGMQEDDASRWGYVNAKEVRNQISAAPTGTTDLIVHLNSYGGSVDAGFAMFDMIASSGYKITTIVEGMVASIATVIMLSGETRKITENSDILIHNPFAFAMGTADEIEKSAEMLQELEDKIVNLYIQKTGAEKATLLQLMEDEERISSSKAVELGFATEVILTIKAVAIVSMAGVKKDTTNSTNKKLTQMSEATNKILNSIKAITEKLGITDAPKNLTLTTADGVILDISTQEKQAEVGNQVKIDNKDAEDGEYLMANKETLVVKDGKIESIKEAKDMAGEPVAVSIEVVDAIRQDSEKVKSAVVDLAALVKNVVDENRQAVTDAKTEYEGNLKEINGKVDAMLTAVGSDYTPPLKEIESGKGEPAASSPAALAIARNKEKDEAAKEDE